MVLGSSSRPSFLSMRNSWTSLRWSPWSWITSPISESLTMVPLQARRSGILASLPADQGREADRVESNCRGAKKSYFNSEWWGKGHDVPNFFLMTLRIFFWSNFLGSPWTVVKVLRPLRSVCNPCQYGLFFPTVIIARLRSRQIGGASPKLRLWRGSRETSRGLVGARGRRDPRKRSDDEDVRWMRIWM
jgi:hypothetical protein